MDGARTQAQGSLSPPHHSPLSPTISARHPEPVLPTRAYQPLLPALVPTTHGPVALNPGPGPLFPQALLPAGVFCPLESALRPPLGVSLPSQQASGITPHPAPPRQPTLLPGSSAVTTSANRGLSSFSEGPLILECERVVFQSSRVSTLRR